ncbi:hypothetical protein AVEN_253666-1 [Araneus ventricosus]|uniref:Secreted protein n=1 Tax=Araneus ventricosus TaxID=182803 RepID=A0A4Y2VTU9_ARAVE|nr:hypothetical protein AVEN_253666-1 [Araneus ventricosus]
MIVLHRILTFIVFDNIVLGATFPRRRVRNEIWGEKRDETKRKSGLFFHFSLSLRFSSALSVWRSGVEGLTAATSCIGGGVMASQTAGDDRSR